MGPAAYQTTSVIKPNACIVWSAATSAALLANTADANDMLGLVGCDGNDTNCSVSQFI